MITEVQRPDVAVIGAGPAGLTAATELARGGALRVVIYEREREPGGIPRHSDHTGYGMRDLHRVMTGPKYARRLVRDALAAGVTIETGATVTRIGAGRTLEVTSAEGRARVEPRALIVATGARESPRSSRLIPGDRPRGVLTTGQLQNAVHVEHVAVGKRAVIIGTELVSWSSVLTLRAARCAAVAMVTEHPRTEAYAPAGIFGPPVFGTRVHTRHRLAAIEGHGRVSAVVIEDLVTGVQRRIECDTVIVGARWVPDSELLRSAGIALNTGVAAPAVDGGLATSEPGIFAIGNLVHPVETADIAALDGRHVVAAVRRWLASPIAAPVPSVTVRCAAPLRWIAPSVLPQNAGAPARGRYLTWVDSYTARPVVELVQGDRVVARTRLPWPAAPGRPFRIPARLFDAVDHARGDILVRLGR